MERASAAAAEAERSISAKRGIVMAKAPFLKDVLILPRYLIEVNSRLKQMILGKSTAYMVNSHKTLQFHYIL